jgi:diacylglycerol kinase (ATP)
MQGVELVDTTSAEDAQNRTRTAAESNLPMIIAAGGDGSVHNIIQSLLQVETSSALGVLPLGTGNDLCRTLQIPLDPLEAWSTLAAGRTEAIDVTRVTSQGEVRLFSNSSNGGNSSRLLECLDEQMKKDWGTWAYLRAALNVVTDMQTYRVTLKFDQDQPVVYDAWNIVLANGNTAGGGLQIAPQASVTDGLLDVILILDGTPLDLAELTTDLLAGDYLGHERVVYRRARQLQLEMDPEIELIVDGEVLPGSRFQFEVMPQALRVVVGAGFGGIAVQ